MNILILLQDPTPGANGAAGMGSFWIMIILLFAVMWLFMIRPQRQQQKKMQEFRNSLKKGDKVVTAGGIYGEIIEVTEKTALIRVDGDVKLRVDKQSLVKDFSDTEQK